MTFEWNDDFNTGIPIIDEQHKELFKIGNRVAQLWESKDSADQSEAIQKELLSLDKYTRYHFKTEEALFEKYNFDEAEAHKLQHQEFIKFLDEIELGADPDSQHEAVGEILRFIIKWIFKHITHVDFRYKDFLKSQLK